MTFSSVFLNKTLDEIKHGIRCGIKFNGIECRPHDDLFSQKKMDMNAEICQPR